MHLIIVSSRTAALNEDALLNTVSDKIRSAIAMRRCQMSASVA
jgi:hypothetical protein